MRLRRVIGVNVVAACVGLAVACKPAEEVKKPAEPTETTDTTPVVSDIGELHNAGVRYVVARLQPGLPDADAKRVIWDGSTDWCRDTGHFPCPGPERGWPFPPDPERAVASTTGSPAFKAKLGALLRGMAQAENVDAVNSAVAEAMAMPGEPLNDAEAKRLADVASVARASARMWAPVSLGGEGGVKGPISESPAAKAIDWGDVALADAIGCALGWETGCLAAGIISSAWEYYKQSKA